MAAPSTAARSPVSRFFQLLRSTQALRGVEVLVGAAAMPRQTAAHRVVLYPAQGSFEQPGDFSASMMDVQQVILAELWGRGSQTSADPNAQALADYDAAWALLVAFLQALVEQGEAPADPTQPGLFWDATGIAWAQEQDTSQQGAAIQVTCTARCPIPAAATDQGHVGDQWQQGTAEAVDISGAP